MKSSQLLIFFFTIYLIISDDQIIINVSETLSTTDNYIVERNTIILSNNILYDFSGETNIYNIKVSCSCKIILKSLSISSPIYPAILIEENKEVNLELIGESKLADTKSNQNEGVIYLNEEAKLIISGKGKLYIQPNKCMAINGTESSSLTVNSGEIIIESTSTDVGGIHLNKEIIFNNAIFKFTLNNVNHLHPLHAIDSDGSIIIKNGTYDIISGEGIGLQTKKNLYIGNKNDINENLVIKIQTSNKGIEAKEIEIFSGTINITSNGDGINSINDECNSNCKGNCNCYIKFEGGNININSGEDGMDSKGDIFINDGKLIIFGASSGDNQPIDKDGLLLINGGIVLAGGSPVFGGIQANTNQTEGVYIKHVDSATKKN